MPRFTFHWPLHSARALALLLGLALTGCDQEAASPHGDPCAAAPCPSGEVCAVAGGESLCVCPPGQLRVQGACLTAAEAESPDPCAEVDCGGAGECAAGPDGPVCLCAGGAVSLAAPCPPSAPATGEEGGEAGRAPEGGVFDPCAGVECGEYAACVVTGAGTASCECADGYERSAEGCLPPRPPCVADCAGRQCGDDGCGGSCGACPPSETCGASGQCVASAPGCAPDCPPMVLVPAGAFWMGCDESVDAQCPANETPYRSVTLDAFEIDLLPTTVSAYQACVHAGACAAPAADAPTCAPSAHGTYGAAGKESHPVNCVSWYDAETYCAWAGKRLCTEAEWEKAARGTDGQEYPWGDEPPSCELAVYFAAGGDGCGQSSTWPAGSKPQGASPYGALDMAGNVWTWVADWYDEGYYAVSPTSNPPGPETGTHRVLRGGGFSVIASLLCSTHRVFHTPTLTYRAVGFRCCRSAP